MALSARELLGSHHPIGSRSGNRVLVHGSALCSHSRRLDAVLAHVISQLDSRQSGRQNHGGWQRGDVMRPASENRGLRGRYRHRQVRRHPGVPPHIRREAHGGVSGEKQRVDPAHRRGRARRHGDRCGARGNRLPDHAGQEPDRQGRMGKKSNGTITELYPTSPHFFRARALGLVVKALL